MTSLINMQQSAEEAKEYTQPSVDEAPKYPWGLCITLNDDSLEKLGVKTLPAAGTVVTIVARAEVSGVRENQTQGGKTEASLDLQITDMQLGGIETDLTARATGKLYDNK
jgi:hypothetical protein